MAKRVKDLTGMRFGRLTVLCQDGKKFYKSGQSKTTWKCICDCGKTVSVVGESLKSGGTKSCGCYRSEKTSESFKTHGESRTRLHNIWHFMKQRCLNENCQSFKNYGGRGVKVCEDWKNSFESFRDWAISHGYSENLSIDRIDVDGDYCPENCRWVEWEDQCDNKRQSCILTVNGEPHSIARWSEITGIKRSTLYSRHRRGWSDEMCLKEAFKC